MQLEAETSRTTLAILAEARATQATHGARMIRGAVKVLVKAMARALHVHPVAVGQTTAG